MSCRVYKWLGYMDAFGLGDGWGFKRGFFVVCDMGNDGDPWFIAGDFAGDIDSGVDIGVDKNIGGGLEEAAVEAPPFW